VRVDSATSGCDPVAWFATSGISFEITIVVVWEGSIGIDGSMRREIGGHRPPQF